MARTRRVAILAAALLAGPLLAAPPAHATGSYECFGGFRTTTGTPYDLSATSCSGSGYVNVLVTLRFGAAAGTHLCRSAFSWNGTLAGTSCQPA